MFLNELMSEEVTDSDRKAGEEKCQAAIFPLRDGANRDVYLRRLHLHTFLRQLSDSDSNVSVSTVVYIC